MNKPPLIGTADPGNLLARKGLRDAALAGGPIRSRIAAPVRLMRKAIRHPDRAVLRLLLRLRLALSGASADRGRLLAWVSEQFGVDAALLHAEYLASDFRRWYGARRRELRQFGGPQRLGTPADLTPEALYLVVRAAKPRVVVETGVLYGASSAHILAALARNGEGELYSIDLPNESHEPPHDFLVPDELSGRWTLVVGDSRCELPTLLRRLSTIDLFYHDSLHTFQHMTWEYQAALPHLTARGILSSHDVRVAHSVREIFRRNAFPAFCDDQGLRWWTFQNSGFALRDAGCTAGR
jgi:predicted O-methyltransferase YrrM